MTKANQQKDKDHKKPIAASEYDDAAGSCAPQNEANGEQPMADLGSQDGSTEVEHAEGGGEARPHAQGRKSWWAPWRQTKSALPPRANGRRRRRVWALRIVLHGINVLAILTLIAYSAIKTFVRPNDIKDLIKATVEDQTGGRLDIERVRFDVLTGIKLEGVQFYPPKSGDARGYARGGEVDPLPIANFDALDIEYSIPQALTGRLYLKAFRLLEPQVHLRQTDGVFNFASILDYRGERFPPDDHEAGNVQPRTEQKSSGDGIALVDFLPISPALLYMPIEIMVQNIGIKNLRLDMIKEEDGKVAQILVTNGLSLDIGLTWLGNKSSMWTSLISPMDEPFELDIKSAKVDESGAATAELVDTLSLQTGLYAKVRLDDFKRIAFDFALRATSLATPMAIYEGIGSHAKLRVSIDDSYQGLTIDTFEVELAETLNLDLSGRVAAMNKAFDFIQLKLNHSLGLDLAEAARLAQPLVPGFKASGTVSLEDLKIDGTIEPQKLLAAPQSLGTSLELPLPYINGVVRLEDIWFEHPAIELGLEPLSGSVALAAGPALSGAGSQVDLAVDMAVPKVTASQYLALPGMGIVTAGIENLSMKLTTRALYPDMVASVFKLNIEAEHLTASGRGMNALDVPLFVDVDADGRGDLQRLALTSSIQLGELIDASVMADCQNRCERFRLNGLVRLDALEKLHAIAYPFGALAGAAEFMPSKLKGSLDLQFAARGRLPDPLGTPLPDLLEAADLRFNTQLSLKKIGVRVPLMNIDLHNFETRLLANGSTREQQIDLQTRFESLKAEVPQKVNLERFEFASEIENKIIGRMDLSQIMRQLITQVTTKINLGHVDAVGLLPRPIKDTRVALTLSQERMSLIKVDDLHVRLSDYGVDASVYLDTELGADFLPRRLDTKIAAQISHNGSERLPGGIKTSGGLKLQLAVNSKDMTAASVDGEASFDKFNIILPAASGDGPARLVVEDISGQMPFKQQIMLPDLRPKNTDQSFAAVAESVAANPANQSRQGLPPPQSPIAAADAVLAKIPSVELKDEDEFDAPTATDAKLTAAMDRFLDKSEHEVLKHKNVVAVVDYPTIRPFYPEKRPLSVRRVEAANLQLSNMEFDLELRQNWFAINQFMIDFLGGKIQGDFQLAFDAQQQRGPTDIPRRLRTSLHMTRLDSRKLLEGYPNLRDKASSWDLFSNPYIDGTVHLDFDFKSNDMSGGIDITSIGKEQLRMMLYYVDPYDQNPTIGSIRGALDFGEVRKVSIPLKNGEIGMDVDVRMLVPLPVPKLTRFPISQIIQNFKDQAMKDNSSHSTMGANAPVGSTAASSAGI